jgi:hypothetical protein
MPDSPDVSLKELQNQISQISGRVTQNSTFISDNSHMIRREQLERELACFEGKFRIQGYQWKLQDFTGRENAKRRSFVKNLMRITFENQGLITKEENIPALVADCKPAGGAWWDDGPLEVKFSNLILWHHVKEKLAGQPLTIKIRIVLPKILHHIHDDCLHHRKQFREENPTRTLYVDCKNTEPYVSLVEKVKNEGRVRRSRVAVEWSDTCFTDPIANHNGFQPINRNPSKAVRGRGGGGRGSRGGRGACHNLRGSRNSQMGADE